MGERAKVGTKPGSGTGALTTELHIATNPHNCRFLVKVVPL